jgi:hypothetical protein
MHPEIATNDELVRLVREARLDAWFGVVFRNHQGNVKVVDIAMAIRPGKNPQAFESTRSVLCLLAGDTAGSPFADRTNVEIEAIEDAWMNMEPVDGLKRLLRRGPVHRLADDYMPRPFRTGGSAKRAASYSGPDWDSLEGAASVQ